MKCNGVENHYTAKRCGFFSKDTLHGIKDAAHGGMDTGKSWTGAYREQVNKDIITTIPFGRFGIPEEVAKALLYFASDESRWTIGSEMVAAR